MEGIIIVDDPRYYHTKQYLQSKGYIIHDPETTPANLNFVVFPFMDEIDKAIYDDGFFADLKNGALVFSGVRNDYLTKKCTEHKLEYCVIMEDRGIALKNAVPTSEGVIAYLIANRTDTVANSRILVIGYGVCGRDLSKRLKMLGAHVYALVRNREKECAAYADSITPVYPDDLYITKYDVIINTVPGRVLTNETLERTKGALLIDIASKPYGFDMELAKKFNNNSALLRGIPGKYAVRTAGEVLGEYIHRVLSERG